MPVKEFVVTIRDFDERGFGIGIIGDKKIRVPGAVPGDVVLVRKLRKKKAKIIKIIEEGVHRKKPLCPYADFCGGCPWHTIPYKKQLEFKMERIQKLFSGINPRPEIRSIIASPIIYGYRAKMEFVFSEKAGRLALGLRETGSFDKVVDLRSCLLQSSRANEVMNEIFLRLTLLGYKAYNIYTHKGFLRYLVIRYSFSTMKTMVNIVTTSENTLDTETIYRQSKANSIVWVINDSYADVAYGSLKEIQGDKYLIEKVAGLKFYICPQCFYQSNPIQAKKLFKIARAFGDQGDTALDVYSGVGTIALIVSDNFDKVIGIEALEEAVKTAKMNAHKNSIGNVEFISGKAEEVFPTSNIDTVFLDPPRPGLHKRVLAKILETRPKKIVYISCNPVTQVRDIKVLIEKGYTLEIVQPIDMLPGTHHIETIALLYLKS